MNPFSLSAQLQAMDEDTALPRRFPNCNGACESGRSACQCPPADEGEPLSLRESVIALVRMGLPFAVAAASAVALVLGAKP